mmetsp:Transcript_3083/g.12175  ORF Transcript_3083/g.12175 Transcript_3083/m.12175 type:complete len:413 (-) Transcript_3083:918-2156(-)
MRLVRFLHRPSPPARVRKRRGTSEEREQALEVFEPPRHRRSGHRPPVHGRHHPRHRRRRRRRALDHLRLVQDDSPPRQPGERRRNHRVPLHVPAGPRSREGPERVVVQISAKDVVRGEHDVGGGEVRGGHDPVVNPVHFSPRSRVGSPRVPRLALVHQHPHRAGFSVAVELGAPLGQDGRRAHHERGATRPGDDLAGSPRDARAAEKRGRVARGFGVCVFLLRDFLEPRGDLHGVRGGGVVDVPRAARDLPRVRRGALPFGSRVKRRPDGRVGLFTMSRLIRLGVSDAPRVGPLAAPVAREPHALVVIFGVAAHAPDDLLSLLVVVVGGGGGFLFRPGILFLLLLHNRRRLEPVRQHAHQQLDRLSQTHLIGEYPARRFRDAAVEPIARQLTGAPVDVNFVAEPAPQGMIRR